VADRSEDGQPEPSALTPDSGVVVIATARGHLRAADERSVARQGPMAGHYDVVPFGLKFVAGAVERDRTADIELRRAQDRRALRASAPRNRTYRR